MTDYLAGLFTDLAEHPSDWELRSIIADNLEDNWRVEEAEALRWMVKNKKRPYFKGTWAWFDYNECQGRYGDIESDIPTEIYRNLRGYGRGSYREYDSITMAEQDFIQAFIKARKEGWQ